MPFKLTPGLMIIIALIIVAVIGGVALSTRPSAPTIKPGSICTCTISAEIGLAQVRITNQNTGYHITKTAADLPYSFNYTALDQLSFNVTALPGYSFNSWNLNVKPWFADSNPLIFKAETNIVLHAEFLVVSNP